MNILSDIINVNKDALKKTTKVVKYLPFLALIIFVLNIAEFWIQTWLSSFTGGVNFLMGFLRYSVTIFFGSAMIGILSDVLYYGRLNFNRIFDGYKRFFGPFSSVMFIYVLLEWIIYMLSGQILALYTIGDIFLFAIHSLLYEEVYIANNYSTNAYSHIISFLKENILHWLIPMIFYIFIKFRLSFSGLAIFDLKFALIIFVWSFVLAFIYIYKGNLYNILYNSSRRKREFEGMF